MDFSEKTVCHVANLARLELSDEEAARYSKQIGDILGYIEKLSEVDTSNVEPMYQVIETAMPLREDQDEKNTGNNFSVMTNAAEILACAPEHVYGNFKVPQVVASKEEAST